MSTIEERDQFGRTALQRAAASGDCALTTELLAAGADIESRSDSGFTALQQSVRFAWHDGPQDEDGFLISRSENTDIVALLLAAGADPNTTSSSGQSVLHAAVKEERTETVKLLLGAGSRVNEQDELDKTPLDVALYIGNPDVVEALLQGGAPMNNALHAAAGRGQPEIIDILIQHGADVNAKYPSDGQTPLHRAVQEIGEHHKAAAQTLLDHGANPNLQDSNGMTPLHCLARSHDPSGIIPTLVQANADVNAQDRWRRTPLAWALGSDSTVRTLIQAGTDVNLPDNEGHSVLHHVADTGNAGTMKLILQAGGAVNAQDNTGQTPLHLSVADNNPGKVRTLLTAGADPSIVDRMGRRPDELIKDLDTTSERRAALDQVFLKHAACTETPEHEIRKPRVM